MMKYVLRTVHLAKSYHKFKALTDVTMSIEKGAIYGLIGKNGAGKTTLIRIICGLQSPTNGDYILFDSSYKEQNIALARRRIGAIIETPAVYMNLSAKDNLILQNEICGNPSDKNIDALLELVGLKNTDKKKVKNFSLGMRQRLGIAIALLSNPDFLILDEPINGLDPEGIIEIRELILKLNQEKGITILLSSHFLDELSKIATHYGFLDQGRIVREVSNDVLHKLLKKKTEVRVSNPSIFVQYVEEKNISYEVKNATDFTLYGECNLSTMILELDKKGCAIEEFIEKEETLENYYMNLIGGDSL